MLRPALDLTCHAWRQEHGDLIAFGSWWLADDAGPRPCIVLLPKRRQSWQKAKPAVILIDQAWVWDEKIGDGARAARLAYEFAGGLGLDQRNANTLIRIRSIIADHIGDLLAMKPMPDDMRRVETMGEMTIAERETGHKREIEVTERL